MTTERIYLDYNATAPMLPAVAEAMARACALDGNPSSVHAEGRAARASVEDAREAVAASVGADTEAVVFTSGGTEANALALRGAGRARVLASAVEHASVLHAMPGVETVPCDGDGVVRLDALDRMLVGDDRAALVSVMFANNETGVIQPVSDIARIAHGHGAAVHVDAVQGYGRLPLSLAELGADLMTLSAHKAGGPKGVGALVARDADDLVPLLSGGGQERGRRAGTEAVPAIAGFRALARSIASMVADAPRLRALRDECEAAILDVAPDARVLGAGASRLPNTSAIVMPGVANATQVMAFDLDGFAVSAGAACSSGKVGPSHVLDAMGVAPTEANAAIRVSTGWRTSRDDLHAFVAAWRALHARLGRAAA